MWKRLERFRFDAETGSAPYSVKLAVEEGWTREYAARVIEEYRRFLYLTQVMEGQATPSVAVDRAWHMHLTFTHSYWDKLCGEVLLTALHHEPCIGEEEMPRYDDQYERTKAFYAHEFGHSPPADIWPGGVPSRSPDKRRAMAYALLSGGAVAMLTGAVGMDGAFWYLALLSVALGGVMMMAGGILLPDPPRSPVRRRKDSGGCSASVGDAAPPGRIGSDDGAGGCGGGGCGGGD